MTNLVLDCIKARRSTRSFTGEQITAEALGALLEAAIWAPSGSNSQSWLFTAIQNADALARINGLLAEGCKTYIPDDDYPGKHGIKISSQKEGWHFCNHAPTLILATNKPGYENAMADCALALGNIFLAAESMGLGSCYINCLHWLRDDAPLREYLFTLGVPKEHVICGSAAIGYIAKPSPVPPRKPGTTIIIR